MGESDGVRGIVTNIQRFSIHDGPGIRTTVFMKGCNLRCFWCHNPETLKTAAELQLFFDRCIACGECFKRCTNGGHEMSDGQRVFHRENCVGCGTCAETCYAEALVLVGKEMSVDEVVEEVMRDRPFYETSNGGRDAFRRRAAGSTRFCLRHPEPVPRRGGPHGHRDGR